MLFNWPGPGVYRLIMGQLIITLHFNVFFQIIPQTIGFNLMLLLEVKFAINENENLTHHLLSASTADIFSILTLWLFQLDDSEILPWNQRNYRWKASPLYYNFSLLMDTNCLARCTFEQKEVSAFGATTRIISNFESPV